MNKWSGYRAHAPFPEILGKIAQQCLLGSGSLTGGSEGRAGLHNGNAAHKLLFAVRRWKSSLGWPIHRFLHSFSFASMRILTHCGLLICKFRAASATEKFLPRIHGKNREPSLPERKLYIYILCIVYKLEKWVSLCEIWKGPCTIAHCQPNCVRHICMWRSLKLNGYDINFKLKSFHSHTRPHPAHTCTNRIARQAARGSQTHTRRAPFGSASAPRREFRSSYHSTHEDIPHTCPAHKLMLAKLLIKLRNKTNF